MNALVFTAKLEALIGVMSDYPKTPTVFCLHLNWHGEHSADNNEAIRGMERELNVHWMELVGAVEWVNSLLAAQLLRLMVCLDVFLESSGATGISPPEFPETKYSSNQSGDEIEVDHTSISKWLVEFSLIVEEEVGKYHLFSCRVYTCLILIDILILGLHMDVHV